jgi:nucleotide-binding universal stress UspA family protein
MDMRIVIGHDGSDESPLATQLVATPGWPRPLEVVMVAAYDRPLDWTGAAALTLSAEDEASVQRELHASLAAAAAPLRTIADAVSFVVRPGPAANVLMDVAREVNADLLVVGNRGRGPARSTLLGSVSAHLVDHAPCPVLVARGTKVERVLLAVDRPETASTAAQALCRWGAFRDAPIDVLTVIPDASPAPTDFITAWAHERDADAGRTPSAADLATRVAAQLSAEGWRARGVVRAGDPASEIAAAAMEFGADLIVTGSRGFGGLRRLVVGSVAHDVMLHARVSVLVLRGGHARSARHPGVARMAQRHAPDAAALSDHAGGAGAA